MPQASSRPKQVSAEGRLTERQTVLFLDRIRSPFRFGHDRSFCGATGKGDRLCGAGLTFRYIVGADQHSFKLASGKAVPHSATVAPLVDHPTTDRLQSLLKSDIMFGSCCSSCTLADSIRCAVALNWNPIMFTV